MPRATSPCRGTTSSRRAPTEVLTERRRRYSLPCRRLSLCVQGSPDLSCQKSLHVILTGTNAGDRRPSPVPGKAEFYRVSGGRVLLSRGSALPFNQGVPSRKSSCAMNLHFAD